MTTPTYLLTSAPLTASLHHPGSPQEAIALLGQFGVEQPAVLTVDDVHAFVHHRYEHIHGYRPTISDRLMRLIGIRKRWPLMGAVITSSPISASHDLAITLRLVTVARVKLIFIAQDIYPSIATQLFTLKRLA
jgi:hypothetical protein